MAALEKRVERLEATMTAIGSGQWTEAELEAERQRIQATLPSDHIAMRVRPSCVDDPALIARIVIVNTGVPRNEVQT